MSTVKNFKELRIWQQSMSLVLKIYPVLQDLPVNERFGLALQIRKASISVPSNIAEGQVRGTREFIYFLNISLGSLAELETQLLLTVQLNFLKNEKIAPLLLELESLTRQIHALIKKLKC